MCHFSYSNSFSLNIIFVFFSLTWTLECWPCRSGPSPLHKKYTSTQQDTTSLPHISFLVLNRKVASSVGIDFWFSNYIKKSHCFSTKDSDHWSSFLKFRHPTRTNLSSYLSSMVTSKVGMTTGWVAMIFTFPIPKLKSPNNPRFLTEMEN